MSTGLALQFCQGLGFHYNIVCAQKRTTYVSNETKGRSFLVFEVSWQPGAFLYNVVPAKAESMLQKKCIHFLALCKGELIKEDRVQTHSVLTTHFLTPQQNTACSNTYTQDCMSWILFCLAGKLLLVSCWHIYTERVCSCACISSVFA
jgi:hypothetical protein